LSAKYACPVLVHAASVALGAWLFAHETAVHEASKAELLQIFVSWSPIAQAALHPSLK
jgi:hypothetical protein